MTIPPFTTDFDEAFDVYDSNPDLPFSTEFSSEFPGGVPLEGEPVPVARSPIAWRLMIRVGSSDIDITSTTRFDFTVEMGRDDPNEQPQAGRATFTIDAVADGRGWWLSPGVKIWLDAELGAYPTRAWRRVWTGTITDVRRRFSYVADPDGDADDEDGRYTISVDAAGMLAKLDRLKVPAGVAGAYAEELDGVRVWHVLSDVGVALNTIRPESKHIVNDEMPDHEWRWNAATLTVAGGNWAVFNRTYPVPPIAGKVSARRCEVVIVLTITNSALVIVNLDGGTSGTLYLQAGTWTVTSAIELPADDPSPSLEVVVIPQDEAWGSATWNDLVGTWDDTPADRTWSDVPDATVETTATLHNVDVWQSGWDWGAVWLINRDPTNEQTVRDHIEEIGRAARGTLWEQRDGGVQWASQLSRSVKVLEGALDPSVDLPAGYVRSDTETTQSLSGLVNEATVNYWWEGLDNDGNTIPRPSVTVRDSQSATLHGGVFNVTIDGPLRDRPSADAVARQIIAASSRPRERLSQLETIPLHEMDDPTVIALLTVTPGAVIEVEGTPAGWSPTGTSWKGFLEGWSLTGGQGMEVVMTLNVSEWFEGVAPPTEFETAIAFGG